MKKRSMAMIVIVAITLPLFAVANSKPISGGTLNIAISGDAASLLPTAIRTPQDSEVSSIIFETLFRYDNSGDPQPYLAKSMTPDIKAKTYTMVLNKGIKFQDGTDFNASVCKWNLDLYKQKGVLSSSFLNALQSVEIVDDYTVVLKLSAWDSLIPYALARQCGMMASRVAYEKSGEKAFAERPIGTGPFKLVDWQHDSSLTFKRFDGYWKGKPYLDTVKFTVYTTDLVAQAAMDANEIQAMFTDDFETAKAMSSKHYVIAQSSVPRYTFTVCFECSNKKDPFSDVRVRQAASHAIDSDAIIRTLSMGYGSATTQYGQPGAPFYNASVSGYPYDLVKAKALLAQAGYAKGFDTTINLQNIPLWVNFAQIIADQLAKVGINVKLNIQDQAGWVKNIGGWNSGMFMHTMGMENGAASQISASFLQGLKAGLGIASFIHPDDLNAVLVKGRSTLGTESTESFKQAQALIFDTYCMEKAVMVTPAIAVLSPRLHDSGLCEITASISTLGSAWLSKK